MNSRMVISTTALILGVALTPALAQDEAFQLDELTCFDVISQAEDDALFLTALLIGHVSGVSGTTEMSGAMLKSTVEAMDTACGDNPDMLAVDAVKAG